MILSPFYHSNSIRKYFLGSILEGPDPQQIEDPVKRVKQFVFKQSTLAFSNKGKS